MKKTFELFYYILSVIFSMSSFLFAQVQWEKNFEGNNYYASTLLWQEDGSFLVGTGDMKVHKIDQNGNYVELFYQLNGNSNSWTSFEAW